MVPSPWPLPRKLSSQASPTGPPFTTHKNRRTLHGNRGPLPYKTPTAPPSTRRILNRSGSPVRGARSGGGGGGILPRTLSPAWSRDQEMHRLPLHEESVFHSWHCIKQSFQNRFKRPNMFTIWSLTGKVCRLPILEHKNKFLSIQAEAATQNPKPQTAQVSPAFAPTKKSRWHPREQPPTDLLQSRHTPLYSTTHLIAYAGLFACVGYFPIAKHPG